MNEKASGVDVKGKDVKCWSVSVNKKKMTKYQDEFQFTLTSSSVSIIDLLVFNQLILSHFFLLYLNTFNQKNFDVHHHHQDHSDQ